MIAQPGSHFNLGPVGDILKKPCPDHDPLLQFIFQNTGFSEDELPPSPQDNLIGQITNERKFIGLSNSGEGFEYCSSDHEILLVDASSNAQTPGLGRVPDTDWVDTGLLREWMGECLAEHSDMCDNLLKLPHISPAWLIDTIGNCLVAGDGGHDYIALSYRWGSAVHLQNKLSILDPLQHPGALGQTEFGDLIAPTVKHAMGLTRIMGERYLWVDALCIVQDDNEETRSQLQLMGAIYASAKLTIVALDGDASDGIPGLEGISPPRKLAHVRFPPGESNQLLVRQNPVLSSYLGKCSPYFTRAWTFQEYCLSKRRLIIGNKQFHWMCSCTACHEDIHGADVESQDLESFQFPQILSGEPDFADLNMPLAEYNNRNLTFPEDALAGISGFLAIMSRSFEGGFIYGLAEMCFDSALMWTTGFGPPHMGMQRRIDSGKNHSILEGSKLPSWSWLGWKGNGLAFDQEYTGEFYDTRFITKPITQWYSQETPTSSMKRAICPTLLDYDKDSREDRLEDLLTKGWTREEFDPARHLKTESWRKPILMLGEYVYKHPSLSGRLFWSPLPMKDARGDSGMSSPPQHPFLSCNTKRGRFNAKQSVSEQPFTNDDYVIGTVSVLGKDQEPCGYLQIQCEEYAAEFAAADSDETRTLELVAICFRRLPGRTEASIVKDNVIRQPQFKEIMLSKKVMPRSTNLNNLNTENANNETSYTPSSTLGKLSTDQVGVRKALSPTIDSNYKCIDYSNERGEGSQTHLDKHWLFNNHVESSDGGFTPRALSPIDSNTSTTPVARSYTPSSLNHAITYDAAEAWSGFGRHDVVSSWLQSIAIEVRPPRHRTSPGTDWRDKASHMGSSLDGPTSPHNGADDLKDQNDNDNDDAETCPQVTQHHIQFHNFKSFALKSCPELHKAPFDCFEVPEFKGPPSDGQSLHDDETEKATNKTRHSMRQAMSRGLRSLGRRFHRSSSGYYSIRSDLPVPLEGKERRLLAREPADVYPSSGSETPLFNTPESGGTPTSSTRVSVEILAVTGTMIAASELDRLSSTGTVRTGPASIAGTILDPQHDHVHSPVVPSRLEHRRRAARRSRLSEVTTPEDLPTPESMRHHLHTSPDVGAFDDPTKGELRRLVPRPLKLNRNSEDEQSVAAPRVTQSAPVAYNMSSPGADEGSTKPTRPDIMAHISDLGDTKTRPPIPTSGARPHLGKTTSSNAPVKISDPPLVASIPRRAELGSSINHTTSVNDNSGDVATTEDQCSMPRHPDTGSETGGEPGDSDPFCPPECGSRHSHEILTSPRRSSGLLLGDNYNFRTYTRIKDSSR
ncbi:heterokaryon incompatibility protein-domain-containing protein [Apiospora arundinis]|uniref:Heterokaryon incompatibility protein-domain-containing protein n=1 Tax=Apiospora arundinis TaxID=335852 RepID=A0ABR2J6V0_9PEZI